MNEVAGVEYLFYSCCVQQLQCYTHAHGAAVSRVACEVCVLSMWGCGRVSV